MRFIGLIVAALLASTSIAAAQTCPGTSSACPPLSTSQINLGGAIVSPTGVPLTPPVTMPSGSGLVLTTTDAQGHTAWLPGGSASLPTSAPLIGANSSGAGITVTPSNGLTISGSNLIPTYGTSAGTFAQGNDSRIVGALQSVPAPTLSVLGGVIAQTAQSGQFVSFIDSSGVQHFATPAGGGNVSNSGTPTANQLAVWNSSTVIGGSSSLPSGVTSSSLTSFGASPILVTPNLGTPSAAVLTNATGLPIAGMTGLGTGVASALGSAVTGSGGLVGATSPTLVTPALGTPSAAVLTNATGLPWTAGVTGKPTTGTGYGIATIDAIPLGSITPSTGAFTTLSASGNISQAGVGVIGTNITGAVAGLSLGPGVVVNTPSIDYSTAGGNVRNNQFTATLAPSSPTSIIWENGFAGVILASGTANGEINAWHAYLQVNAGATFAGGENVETSFLNNGTVTGATSFAALYNNASTGTTNTYKGLSGGLTNANTAAGSIVNYSFINFSPANLTGGGTLPTNYLFIQNNDANAGTALAGHLAVGNVAAGQAWSLTKGPDTVVGTWLFDLENSASAHLMLMKDDGSTSVSGAWAFGSTGAFTGSVSAPAYTIAGGVLPTVGTSTGAGGGGTATVTGNQNSQVVTVVTGSGTAPATNALIAAVNVGGIASTNGPAAVVTAGNAAAAAVITTISAASAGVGKTYNINSGAVALAASTTYIFNVHSWSY